VSLDPNDTQKDARAAIAEYAADAFKTHELTKLGEGRWICRKAPVVEADGKITKSWVYGFYVVLSPGAAMVYGDVGTCLILHYDLRTEDASWLRGAVKSPQYLFEKMHRPPNRFYTGDAIAFLEEHFKEQLDDAKERQAENEDKDFKLPETPEYLREARELAEHGELHQGRWAELMNEHGFDDAYSIGTGPDTDCYWSLHALKTFIDLLDAAPKAEPA
jgi:hypothetical protein